MAPYDSLRYSDSTDRKRLDRQMRLSLLPATEAYLVKRPWLLPLVLVLLTFAAYQPVWHAGFIWDDYDLIVNNPSIRTSDGLYRIWDRVEPPDYSYWPLTYTTWWLEWHLWGTNPLPYHVVNVILHAFNAVLWWLILEKLKIPGAWLVSAVFALHPVNVESVAWITQRKNTLAMLLSLLTLLFYLRFDDTGQRRWSRFALGTFVFALLSKSAVVMLPLVLLGIAWWRRGKVKREDISHSVPFFVVASLLCWMTISLQYHRVVGSDVIRQDSFWSRLAGAGWAVWFYIYKAMLPWKLCFVYPRWHIDATNMLSYVPTLFVAVALLLSWLYRRNVGKPFFFGLGYFVLMLLPALGFANIYFMRYSLVADHWQYFSLIGLIALIVNGGRKLCERLVTHSQFTAILLSAGILTTLGVLTWQQAHIYRDVETLWRDTLAKNPEAWMARNNLGAALKQSGRTDDAIRQFEQALRLNPDDANAQINLGTALLEARKIQEAIPHFEHAVRVKPDSAIGQNGLGVALLNAGRIQEAATHFELALKIDPNSADAHCNRGIILFQAGRVQDAIAELELAAQLKPDSAETHFRLGNALRQTGRIEDAIGQYEQAVRLNPDFAEAKEKLARLRAN